MANFVLDLNKFKASGVYTVELDQSERIVVDNQTLRLIVGFSKKGPFNTPVFLRNVRDARRIFGDIDKSLEKRGSFFHRSLENALQFGPVFALNLWPLNNSPVNEGGDSVEYRTLSVDAGAKNGIIKKELLSAFFNKERFWIPSTKNFLALVNNNPINRGGLLNIVNTSQGDISVIIKKAKVNGYSVTAEEWYGNADIPEFINKFDLIEDYFLDVIIIKGKWNDYKELSTHPEWSKYFDLRGVKKDKLDDFLSREDITLVGRWVGCIIPDFIDKNGVNQFIETIVNNNFQSTGVMISVNKDALNDYQNSIKKVDLVGVNIINSNIDKVDFLSYTFNTTNSLKYENMQLFNGSTPNIPTTDYTFSSTQITNNDVYLKWLPLFGDNGIAGNVLAIKKPLPSVTTGFTLNDYNYIKENLNENSLIKNVNSTNKKLYYSKVDKIIDTGSELHIYLSNPEFNITGGNAYSITKHKITSVNTSTNEITADSTLTSSLISGNDIILVKGPGFYGYYKVNSFTPLPSSTITIETNISSANYPVFESINLLDNLTGLNNAILNSNINDFELYVIPIATTVSINNNFYDSDTGNDKLKISFYPDVVFKGTDSFSNDFIEAYPFSKLSSDIKDNVLVNGDLIYSSSTVFNYISTEVDWSYQKDSNSNIMYGLKGVRIKQYDDSSLLTPAATFIDFDSSYDIDNSITFNPSGNEDLIFYSQKSKKLLNDIEILSYDASKRIINLNEVNAKKLEVGYYVVTDDDRLTKIISKTKIFNTSTGLFDYKIELVEPAKIISGTPNKIKVFTPIDVYVDNYNFTSFNGFKLTNYHLPGSEDQVDKIYGVLYNTNIALALTDKNIIDFRYIVDTMSFGLRPMMGGKVYISRLAKDKGKCLALLNAPPIEDFIKSTDPVFTDEPTPDNPLPTLNTSYIVTGGNLSLSPSFKFTLPDEDNGAKHIGVFAPFLVYRENNQNFLVPPASDVSNNFIRKFIIGQPYSIVAGTRRGVLSNSKLAGLEYDFSLQDRENLEPFGINPIVSVKNIGFMIFGNQTAYQKVISAFNNIHIRDLLITIENDIEGILINYLYEFNNAITRLEIKSIISDYLEKVRNAGGLYDYSVIMDERNNTPDIIDQNFAIVDIGIEPVRGMQKIINRITILKTGAISSGGFTVS